MPGFFEVLPEERQEPTRARSFAPNAFVGPIACELVCARRAANLQAEITHTIFVQGVAAYNDAALPVLRKDRRCEHWCEYEPGFDPRDHLMELKARRLEQDRKDFQRQMFEMEQRLRNDREVAWQEYEDGERRRDRRLNRFGIILIILGLMFSGAQVLASLLTMTKDSFGFTWLSRVVPRLFH